jgi:hypothetical protein
MYTYTAEELKTIPESVLVDYAERVLRKTIKAYRLIERPTNSLSLLFQLTVENHYDNPEHAYRLARLLLWYIDRITVNMQSPEQIVSDADHLTTVILSKPRLNTPLVRT